MNKQNHWKWIAAALCIVGIAAIVILLFGRQQGENRSEPLEYTSPSVSFPEKELEEQAPPESSPDETVVPAPEETAAASPSASPTTNSPKQSSAPSPSATVPAATPKPAPSSVPQPSKAPSETETAKPTAVTVCTLTVRCDTLTAKRDSLAQEMQEIVPENGVVLAEISLEPQEGETAFSLLQRAAREKKLHLEFQTTPGTGGVYVEGIGNLYEFDGGPLSGWLYRVNGVFYPESASQYALSPGDRVEWIYTCDLGRDVGAPSLE